VNLSESQAATHISRVSCAEITGDRPKQLHMKILASNVDFNNPSFDPLGSRSPPFTGIKCGTSTKRTIPATVD